VGVKFFVHSKIGSEATPPPCAMGTEDFCWGVALTTHPIQRRCQRTAQLYLFSPSGSFMACCRVHLTFTFTITFRIRATVRYVKPCSTARRGTRQFLFRVNKCGIYRGADKFLARPPSRCFLFDGQNISFDASLVLYIYIYKYINSTNIPPIMIINRTCETQNLLSL